MNLDWTNLVSVDSIQPGHSQLMLDWVSSAALVGMEWGERLPNTVPDLIALPFFNLGEQNELRLDKFDIITLHSTWTFTI